MNRKMLMFADHPSVIALRNLELRKYDSHYFSEHYWREDLPGKSGNRGLSYNDPEHIRRFDFLYNALIGTMSPMRVLDAGCGPGYLLERMLNSGIDAYGVDCSERALLIFQSRGLGRQTKKVLKANLDSLPFRDDVFDLVICLDVLEHLIVFDALFAVSELCRIASKTIICSINLDNPYEFHPTVLSRESWNAIFESTNLVSLDIEETGRLNELIRESYQEYELFVFRKKI